eukprot:CAMPEP_0114977198 /NCGR_PEP_ID=MMETSP0216-20121206/3100_1 /TAXON_ID=223996 /ORGANISM="Protocruzia adherens, Strain Boccale" /LENGTH=80 /DNA_ID=CAMNT_0002338221 /DNA_START=206 /DNA_END=448 /DNA_ORIENTATION=+
MARDSCEGYEKPLFLLAVGKPSDKRTVSYSDGHKFAQENDLNFTELTNLSKEHVRCYFHFVLEYLALHEKRFVNCGLLYA